MEKNALHSKLFPMNSKAAANASVIIPMPGGANSRHAAQQFSPYNYHGSSMDEITRNHHQHHNIIMIGMGADNQNVQVQQSNTVQTTSNSVILNTKSREQQLQSKLSNKQQDPSSAVAVIRQAPSSKQDNSMLLYQTSTNKFAVQQQLNRESLQSRLLDRINTKKQRMSPNQKVSTKQR